LLTQNSVMSSLTRQKKLAIYSNPTGRPLRRSYSSHAVTKVIKDRGVYIVNRAFTAAQQPERLQLNVFLILEDRGSVSPI
jgi:hypothetical protein